MTVDLYFLVVPYKRIYKSILGMPFATTLDLVASPVHIKLNNHNVHDELAT